MPRKAKPLDPLDRAAINVLNTHVARTGASQRKLAVEAGMTLNRVGIILRADGPGPTIGEFAVLCEALGLDPVQVLREAEAVVAAREREPVPRAAEAGLPPVWELAASDHGGWEAERREREGLPAVEPEDESQVLPDDVD